MIIKQFIDTLEELATTELAEFWQLLGDYWWEMAE